MGAALHIFLPAYLSPAIWIYTRTGGPKVRENAVWPDRGKATH
jgi:hypothetical protein